MADVNLELLGLNTNFYSTRGFDIYFKTTSTYDLITKNWGVSNGNENYIQYKLIKNKRHYYILSTVVHYKVQYITVGNRLNSIILSLSKIPAKQLYYYLFATNSSSDNDGYLRGLLLSVEDMAKHDTKGKENKWVYLDIGNHYNVTAFIGEKINFYAKRKESGEILLGICIRPKHYNYFEDKDKVSEIEYNFGIKPRYSGKIIEKLRIEIGDKLYYIDNRHRDLGILNLITKLHLNDPDFIHKSIGHLEIDGYMIRYKANGIGDISLTKEKADNVTLWDNHDNQYKLSDLITKMNMMGVDKLDDSYFDNITIYSYFDKFFQSLSKAESIEVANEYKYTIQFIW